jgi:isocitrate/isopropylmalate dehydrogenase
MYTIAMLPGDGVGVETVAILLGAIGWPAPHGRGTAMRPDGKMAGWSAIVGTRIGLEDTRVVTRRATERIIRLAFETAMRRDRVRPDRKPRLTCVVKDNILHGCRLFVRISALDGPPGR